MSTATTLLLTMAAASILLALVLRSRLLAGAKHARLAMPRHAALAEEVIKDHQAGPWVVLKGSILASFLGAGILAFAPWGAAHLIVPAFAGMVGIVSTKGWATVALLHYAAESREMLGEAGVDGESDLNEQRVELRRLRGWRDGAEEDPLEKLARYAGM